MLMYILRRIVYLFITIFFVSLLTYGLLFTAETRRCSSPPCALA